MKKIIYIASDVRSGSTLLDNLLSNHPKAASMGELALLNSYLNKGKSGNTSDWICTCGKGMDSCSVWSSIADIYERKYGYSLKSADTKLDRSVHTPFFHVAMVLSFILPFYRIRKKLLRWAYRHKYITSAGRILYNITDIYLKITASKIAIDSSKKINQLYALIETKPDDIELKVIHIVRDGRAVLYSKAMRAEQYKKYGISFNLISGIFEWCYANMKILNITYFLEPRNRIFVHYEDLCNSRETVLKSICNRFGITFDKHMLRLSGDNKHNIGGTSHRFTWNSETDIHLDERWKSALNWRSRIAYSLLAWPFHKKLGYGYKERHE